MGQRTNWGQFGKDVLLNLVNPNYAQMKQSAEMQRLQWLMQQQSEQAQRSFLMQQSEAQREAADRRAAQSMVGQLTGKVQPEVIEQLWKSTGMQMPQTPQVMPSMPGLPALSSDIPSINPFEAPIDESQVAKDEMQRMKDRFIIENYKSQIADRGKPDKPSAFGEANTYMEEQGILPRDIARKRFESIGSPKTSVTIGGAPKGMSGESAAYWPLMNQSVTRAQDVKNILFPNWQSGDIRTGYRRDLIGKMILPAGMLDPEVQKLDQMLDTLVMAKLRIESKAAITKDEMVQYKQMYKPKITDTPEVVWQKINDLMEYSDIASQAIDPTGQYAPVRTWRGGGEAGDEMAELMNRFGLN